jgi:Domain of unknown function (DUF4350)
MQVTAADRKILLISAVLLVLMIGAALLFVHGQSSNDQTPTVYSAASGGCKAAFLLLQEAGYHVQTWEQPVLNLPDGKDKTLIIVEPSSSPPHEEREKLESFVRGGGRLIAAGQLAGFYLPQNDVVADPLRGTVWKQISALSPSPITRSAPKITMAPQSYWRTNTGSVGLYGDADKPVVIEYRLGHGDILWVAAATPLTNAGLRETGNLEFLLAAVGAPDRTEILWDEYIHGYQHFASSKTHRIIGWIGLQLAILAIAALLAYSRRSGPVWNPEGEVRLSPLEFVRTLGSLYEQANAGGVAVDISCQRFRYLLTRRLGLSLNSTVDDVARAVRERYAFSDSAFAITLSESESYRYDSYIPPKTALRLVQALFDYAVRLRLMPTSQGEKKAWNRS